MATASTAVAINDADEAGTKPQKRLRNYAAALLFLFRGNGGVRGGLGLSAVACASTCVMSSWLVLYNKWVLSNVFPCSTALLLVQNIVTIALVLLGRRVGLLDYQFSFAAAAKDRGAWIAGAAYTVNVMAGVWSLTFLSVPMFSTLKRLTTAFSWILEWQFAPRPDTRACLGPIVVMVAATVVAGSADLDFHLYGYLFALVSCLAQSSAFELGRRFAMTGDRGIWPVLLVNSSVALLVQLLVVGCSKADREALAPWNLSGRQVVHLALNSGCCVLMNFCIFFNCVVNSALAHVVTGNIKAVIVTLGGTVLMSHPMPVMEWAGISGNILGAAGFSIVRLGLTKHCFQKKSEEADATGSSQEERGPALHSTDVEPSTTRHRPVPVGQVHTA